MSISNVLSPSALLSQAASKSPLAAAVSFGAGSFASTLMQALQQAGTAVSAASAPSGAAAAAASTAAGGTSAVHGHHHGHHGGGRFAAQLAAAGLTTPGTGQLLNAKV